jgi:lysozyme
MTHFHESEEFMSYKDTSDKISLDGKKGLWTWGVGWCLETRPADQEERDAIRRITGMSSIPFDRPLELRHFLDGMRAMHKVEVSAYMHRSHVLKNMAELETQISFWPELDDNRAAALVDVSFCVGVAGLLKFKNTLRLMGQQKWIEAGHEILDSDYARQLPNRSKRISKVIASGEWPADIKPEPKD